MFIVSRNYRDRTSPYKWLFRKEGEAPEQAVACKAIVCKRTVFQESNAFETGFGCRMVARCEDVEAVDVEPRPFAYRTVKLQFDLVDTFYEAGTTNRVINSEVLTLTSAGDMFARLPA